MVTVEKTVSLTIIPLHCGHFAALTKNEIGHLQEVHGSIFCAYGHSWSYTETETDRLRHQLATAEERANGETSARLIAEATLEAERSVRTKQAKRADAGVCLHCHRTFRQLQRHMASKHAVGR